jgi:hypothetical protein
MKRLSAAQIKKIILGVVVSDGHIDKNNSRFDFYSKHESHAEYIADVLSQITNMHVTLKVKRDKRGYVGYRVFTRKHAYWKNMSKYTYPIHTKEITPYTAVRLDAEAFAHVWMCDGYLEHSKNRKKNTVQNIGWFCLEAFPKYQLRLLQKQLRSLGVESTLTPKPWGHGYRIRIGGLNLQKFISIVYPYILDCFIYKTLLFYKKRKSADMYLSNAKQYIHTYECIEDIVRHPMKIGQQ